MRKLLFVCSRNRIRSLTAEKIFDGPDMQARSAGTQPGARVVITEGMIGWADVVFVMEKRHLANLRARFSELLETKRVVVLNIRDEFEYMQRALIDELETKVAEHIGNYA